MPTNPYILAAAVICFNLMMFNFLFGFPTAYVMVYFMNKAHPFDENSKLDPSFGHLHEENEDKKQK